MVGIRQEHRRQAIKSDHTVGLGIGNRLHKILAPQALVVGMMAERERHRDAKLFGPHRDSRQPRTEEIAIFLNERHDVADFLEFLVDPAFLISGRIGREFVMLRSEEHTSELQSLMRISYAVFCLKKKKR